jgi:iron complex outermembrane receptor protein
VIAATTFTIDPYNYVPTTYESNSAKLSAKNELLTVSGFMENRLTLIPKLNLVTGLRVDSIDLDNKNFLDPLRPSPLIRLVHLPVFTVIEMP